MSYRSRGLTVLMTALFALSVFSMAFAGGAAADVTNTGDLAGDGSDSIADYAADADENHTLTYDTDNNSDTVDDFDELSLEIAYDGNTYAELSSDDAEVSSGGDDDTTALEVEWTIDHDTLEKLPGGALETTTANYTVTELSSGDDPADAMESEFAVDYEFDSSHAVITVHDDGDDSVTVNEDDGGLFGVLSFGDSDPVATIEDDVAIDGANTTVHVYAEDSDVADAFDAALDGAEDGDRVGTLMASTLDGSAVYAFANESGETITGDEVDADTDSYIVAQEGGEAEINLGEDDFEDADEVEVSLVGNEKFDRGALQSDLDYSMFQAWGLSFNGFSNALDSIMDNIPFLSMGALAVGIPITRRRYGA